MEKKSKGTGGRPTKMTPEVQEEILDRIVKGESVVKILNSSSKFPDYSNFTRFLDADENEVFRMKYVRAKEDQADYLAEEIKDISDEATPEDVQVAKLRVDTRKWIASKLKAKKYGDRLNNVVSGDAENPLVNVNINFDENTPDVDLDKFLDEAKKG